MNTRTFFSLGAVLALSALGGCATPVQTFAPKPVPQATGEIKTVVYTQVDLIPHPVGDYPVTVISRIKELGGAFHEKGYEVTDKTKWQDMAFVDGEWALIGKPDGKVQMIPYGLQDRYPDAKVTPAASTEVLAQLGDVKKANGGAGVFDADGSTYSNGAAMTGSLGGGLVVGLAVGAVQTVAHAVGSHDEKPKEKLWTIKRLPPNTAVLVGRIRQWPGPFVAQMQEQRVIIVAASDKEEPASILLDAALRKYVSVYEYGTKANPTSMDEQSATAAAKD